jgi:hypothetical protein
VFHEEVRDHRKQQQTHNHTIGLLLEQAAKAEVGGGQDIFLRENQSRQAYWLQVPL